MMRLPYFRFESPRTVAEAAELLARAAPGEAMLVAGGTDLLPNMKRRQQVPQTLIGLRRVAGLREIANGDGLHIGAGVTLTDLVRDHRVRRKYGALWQAASRVATPQLRNMGTLGGNLCLDTRCNYYDQNYEWRKTIDFCMKKDDRAAERGAPQVCWVATSSPRCLAVSSTDTAPALIALDAQITLVSADGSRQIAAADLFQNDGIHYLRRRPGEILTSVQLAPLDGWRSVYWKLRRRGSFDFPVLSVAAAVKLAGEGTVEGARIVLGAVASRPVEAADAAAGLIGGPLSDAAIAGAAERAAQPARPMDNTDFTLLWRKRVTRQFVSYALRELRGEDMREVRRKIEGQ
ncbi:MAG TPA: FAD binding domain-containing protein [Vicinamibacterales bacterium]|nr:FAD binding domain-containing protein [Vicinamibacterales bacterium]